MWVPLVFVSILVDEVSLDIHLQYSSKIMSVLHTRIYKQDFDK